MKWRAVLQKVCLARFANHKRSGSSDEALFGKRSWFAGVSNSWADGTDVSKATKKVAAEVRERANQMVLDHEQAYPLHRAIMVSFAEKIGRSQRLPNNWVKKAEIDKGKQALGLAEVGDSMKGSRQEVPEFPQAGDVLRNVPNYFALAGLNRPFKR